MNKYAIELPNTWELKRAKYLFSEVNDRSKEEDKYTLLSVSEYYGVAPKSEKISEGDFETHAESLDGYKICQPNDIVMNIMLAWKKSTAISNYCGIVSPAYCVFRGKNNIIPRYYHYLFRTDLYATYFKCYSTGIIDSRLRLYPEVFLGLTCHYPPIDDQLLISDYLDKKTQLIDNIIENEIKLVDNLKEFHKSIISETVTKGLNKDVEMKESGNEWVGTIPSNWNLGLFKYEFSLKKGLNITKTDLVDSGVPTISYGQVHSKSNEGTGINESLIRYVPESYLIKDKNSLVGLNDFIFADTSEDLEGIGNCVYVDREGILFAGSHTLIAHVLDDTKIYPKYLSYLFLSYAWRNQIRMMAMGIKVYSITQRLIGNTVILIPPYNEQIEIVKYLDKKCKHIINAISEKEMFIRKLDEYKKSLIYECVIGKQMLYKKSKITKS